jgi:hypothetical protein
MSDPREFDPDLLFGPPREEPPWRDPAEKLRLQAAALVLEFKAGPSPLDTLLAMMAEMTEELRLQFEFFRSLRRAAEAALAGGGDEAAMKLARADAKAANEALTQLVRTFEKIDSLQRTLARDRDDLAEREIAQPALAELLAGIECRIEARAREQAEILLAERLAAGAPFAGGGDRPGDTGPPAP